MHSFQIYLNSLEQLLPSEDIFLAADQEIPNPLVETEIELFCSEQLPGPYLPWSKLIHPALTHLICFM